MAIRGSDATGVFHAIQTLRQLIPADAMPMRCGSVWCRNLLADTGHYRAVYPSSAAICDTWPDLIAAAVARDDG